MSAPRFTLEEQEKVVEEAINLIKEPASWVTGQWKCDLIETDKNGNPIVDEEGRPQLARDLYNRPLSQYCIEGAVNQAVVNVLGKPRAEKLGAWNEYNDVEGDGEDASIWPTDLLGIDELARARYPEICSDESHASMILNDYHASQPAKGHKRVLGLLTDTLASIKAKRKR